MERRGTVEVCDAVGQREPYSVVPEVALDDDDDDDGTVDDDDGNEQEGHGGKLMTMIMMTVVQLQQLLTLNHNHQ